MSTIIADCQGSNSFFSTTIGGAIRWSAVELYRFEQEGYFAALNIDTDIYSFGSVMLQASINELRRSQKYSRDVHFSGSDRESPILLHPH
jgi:hypothetical protein